MNLYFSFPVDGTPSSMQAQEMEEICELRWGDCRKTSSQSKYTTIQLIGCGKLPIVNEDIIDLSEKFTLKF